MGGSRDVNTTGVDRPCDDPLLAVLERYWNRSCSRDNFSCWGSGSSDMLDRPVERGDVGVPDRAVAADSDVPAP